MHNTLIACYPNEDFSSKAVLLQQNLTFHSLVRRKHERKQHSICLTAAHKISCEPFLPSVCWNSDYCCHHCCRILKSSVILSFKFNSIHHDITVHYKSCFWALQQDFMFTLIRTDVPTIRKRRLCSVLGTFLLMTQAHFPKMTGCFLQITLLGCPLYTLSFFKYQHHCHIGHMWSRPVLVLQYCTLLWVLYHKLG